LVEDHADVREFVSRVLDHGGFHMVPAADAAAALALLNERLVDLILLDLSLPDMNGMVLFEVIRAQERLRQIPVVFLTGQDEPQLKVKAFEGGAADYIVKPFNVPELIARVRFQLRHRAELEQQHAIDEQRAGEAQAKLVVAEQRFQVLVKNSSDLVCELDADLRVVYFSPNHQDVLLYYPDQLVTAHWPDMVHIEDRDALIASLQKLLHAQTSGRILHRFRDNTYSWRWLDTSGSSFINAAGENRLLLVSRDITNAKQTEEKLKQLALHDSLTRLGNRQRFANELAAIVRDGAEVGRCAVVYLDIDNFKLINDTKGHAQGDQVLNAVAALLRSTFTTPHLICRLGGDEFCILLRGVDDTEALAATEHLVHTCRHQPIGVAGNQLGVTISAGIAMVEADVPPEEVLSRADSALHAAKVAGKNRARFYHAENEELLSIRRSAEWYHRVQEACRKPDENFTIWYQPVRHMSDSSLLCYEALLRIRGAEGVLHFPAEFIPSAERYNLMSQIDRVVIYAVLRDLAEYPQLCVAINLSGNSVTEPGMADFIATAFAATHVDPARVIFEITETVFITNLAAAQALVHELQALGCLFALDDFGSGFSSLNYLKNLPVNVVKIDGSFIQRIGDDAVDYALLRSINEIAHLLGKYTVAEYVDSAATLELLAAIGVDYVQGFFMGRPAPIDEVMRHLPESLAESA